MTKLPWDDLLTPEERAKHLMDPRFFEPGLPPGFDISKAVVLDKRQWGIDAKSIWYFWPPTRQFIHSVTSIAGEKTRVISFGDVPPEIKEKAGYVSEDTLAARDWYGATVGHTRAPEGSKYLGIVDGTRYWWHPQWGYMSLAPIRKTREFHPPSPRITRISRDKVPSFLPAPIEISLNTMLMIGGLGLLVLMFLSPRRRA